MDAELRGRAEARLTAAAAAYGLADPRPPYRERLRVLRENHPAAFEQAIGHYEGVVLPELAAADPLETWAAYGSYLGGLTAGGRLLDIDASGRAAPWAPPFRAGSLILFVPDDTTSDVLVAVRPLEPSAAQSATIELLADRRLSLG
jgi:hypothetical protein